MAIRTEPTPGAALLDLDAARAAREEARVAAGGAFPEIKISAGYITVKPEMPLEVADKLSQQDIRGGLADLLQDPADVDALLAAGLTAQDLEALIRFVTGFSLGESSGSSTPSANGGALSSPTSPATTA